MQLIKGYRKTVYLLLAGLAFTLLQSCVASRGTGHYGCSSDINHYSAARN